MHINAKYLGIICCIYLNVVNAATENDKDEFAAFLKQQQSEFNQFEQQQNQEFDAFVNAWREAQSNFLKKVNKKWQDPSLPSSKVWVEYSEDLNARTSVNFEQGEVIIELLNSNNNEQAVKYANQQLTALSQTSVAQTLAKDPIYTAASDIINRNSKLSSNASQGKPSPLHTSKPSKAEATTEEAVLSVDTVQETLASTTPVITKQKDRVKVSYKLPANNLSKRAKKYLPEVYTQAARYKLDPALLLAIIHTESSFNPLARSPIPAFGLMQIVPTSAGKDVSNYLQGKPLLLSPEYLFQAANNVEAGSTYMHLLTSRYFKNIRNPQSRLFLSIAAYNTGPGNVAKTLSGSKSLNQASIAANSMSAEGIYQLMLNKLPAQETRSYVKKVVKRTAYYQEQLQGL